MGTRDQLWLRGAWALVNVIRRCYEREESLSLKEKEK